MVPDRDAVEVRHLAERLGPALGEGFGGFHLKFQDMRKGPIAEELDRVLALGDRQSAGGVPFFEWRILPVLPGTAVAGKVDGDLEGGGSVADVVADFAHALVINKDFHRPGFGRDAQDLEDVLAGDGEIDIVLDNAWTGLLGVAGNERSVIRKEVGARVDFHVPTIEGPCGTKEMILNPFSALK